MDRRKDGHIPYGIEVAGESQKTSLALDSGMNAFV